MCEEHAVGLCFKSDTPEIILNFLCLVHDCITLEQTYIITDASALQTRNAVMIVPLTITCNK